MPGLTPATSVAQAFATIRTEMGDPATLVYNAGSGVCGDVESITLDDFDATWRVPKETP
jgi:NAD(P)-dependent dehydrogenase (short-subunit alcohol dehydrogenase family)